MSISYIWHLLEFIVGLSLVLLIVFSSRTTLKPTRIPSPSTLHPSASYSNVSPIHSFGLGYRLPPQRLCDQRRLKTNSSSGWHDFVQLASVGYQGKKPLMFLFAVSVASLLEHYIDSDTSRLPNSQDLAVTIKGTFSVSAIIWKARSLPAALAPAPEPCLHCCRCLTRPLSLATITPRTRHFGDLTLGRLELPTDAVS